MPHGLGHHVVMNMGRNYLGKYHHFVYDNYFSSVKLAEDLLAQNTYCCSTIRGSRKGWPQQLNKANTDKMAPGEIKAMTIGRLLATVFNDKRKVSVLSTNSSPGVSTVTRRVKGGIQHVEIPNSVLNYNNHMFGVDLADQLRSYYAVGRSGVKWWRYILWFVVQVSIVNAWNLYRAAQRPLPSNARGVSHLKFRLDICSALVAGNVSKGKRKVSQGVSTAGLGSSLSSDHQLERLMGRKGACHWCSKIKAKTNKGRTPETPYGCSICKVHLHKELCFASFHKELASAQ
ncbi:piggyBac transposable element-derived protein 3-like [Aplysia californica]|uniref:PiggyBac transposable element-derived protein 3-like n=1 Tax=Aplysia californica TaxID=6500 RepID=A0ABM1VYP8_APLCA|nr:piggyBac transposable element-derived protein 3-like [Aplysia californica]